MLNAIQKPGVDDCWDTSGRERELFVRGNALLDYPDVEIKCAGVNTSTHMLAEFGWALHMRQRTCTHIANTRPKIWIHSDRDQNFGFRYKLRARPRYQTPLEVFESLINIKPSKFSMSKFEIKNIPISDPVVIRERDDALAHVSRLQMELTMLTQELVAEQNRWRDDPDIDELKARIAELEAADPFVLLSKWTDERISSMDFSVRKHYDLSNVIDLVDHLEKKENDVEIEQMLERMLG